MPGQAGECQFTFAQGSWSGLLEPELKIRIFDTSFIHRNVFTGLTIERANRENITQFILGEDSVKTANTIAELNSELRAVNKNLRQIQEAAFQGIADIETFLNIDISESPEELQKLIESLDSDLKTKKELAQNLESAKTRDELSYVRVQVDIEVFMAKVDGCLQSTFEQVHERAVEMLQAHINQKTSAIETTRNWLYQGLEQFKQDYCPFCGQELQAEAQALLDAYRSYFNDEFDRFLIDTKSILEELPEQFRRFQMSESSGTLSKNAVIVTRYPELSADYEFRQNLTLLAEAGGAVEWALQEWQTKYAEFELSMARQIRIKEQRPYAFVESCSSAAAIAEYNQIKAAAQRYNSLARDTNKILKTFKEGLDLEKIMQEIAILEQKRNELSLRHRRKHTTQACIEYKKNAERKRILEIEIPELQENLDRSQTQFIDEYFFSINRIFKKLGSKEFHISKRGSGRGLMPVIQLVANYSGVEIASDKLRAFFGESDRRALAFSIFWSKIISLDSQEKERTVIVLDDPVTSFDEGRIDRTIRLINDSLADFRQLIILSHYPKYLKTFFERIRDQRSGIQLIHITKNENGSQMTVASPSDFVETEQHIKFRHISDFIEHRHREDVSSDLRVYLETEVKFRYRKQIAENNLSLLGFNDLLDKLHEHCVINEVVRNEIEAFRVALNPRHHTWTNLSQEDKIAQASDLLEFIYERL